MLPLIFVVLCESLVDRPIDFGAGVQVMNARLVVGADGYQLAWAWLGSDDDKPRMVVPSWEPEDKRMHPIDLTPTPMPIWRARSVPVTHDGNFGAPIDGGIDLLQPELVTQKQAQTAKV